MARPSSSGLVGSSSPTRSSPVCCKTMQGSIEYPSTPCASSSSLSRRSGISARSQRMGCTWAVCPSRGLAGTTKTWSLLNPLKRFEPYTLNLNFHHFLTMSAHCGRFGRLRAWGIISCYQGVPCPHV